MTKTVAAIYENGMLKLPASLSDKTPVTAIIGSELAVAEDAERTLWLRASGDALAKTWDNAGDDVFNELVIGCECSGWGSFPA